MNRTAEMQPGDDAHGPQPGHAARVMAMVTMAAVMACLAMPAAGCRSRAASTPGRDYEQHVAARHYRPAVARSEHSERSAQAAPGALSRVIAAAETLAGRAWRYGAGLLSSGTAAAAASPGPGYLKGSTHVHTRRSGDSQTPLDEVMRWYIEHDYDFIVVTDHNRVTAPPSADKAGEAGGELLVIPGVELTHNPWRCTPPPPAVNGRCRIHVNSLFVDLAAEHQEAGRAGRAPGERMSWQERNSKQRIDMYQRALDQSRALGGMTQINHPRWHWGVDGALLAELGRRGVTLFEVANQAFARWNHGTETYASAEDIWDHVLAAGLVMWGVASDDAHHYYDASRRRPRSRVYPAGTGFVMVHAEPTAAAIRDALRRGDFYSSTGVRLAAVARGPGWLRVQVDSPDAHQIVFIGTRDGQGGQVLHTLRGREARFAMDEPGYVRAVITDDQGRKAWTQPAFLP